MRSTSHFKIFNRSQDDCDSSDEDTLVVIRKPVTGPVHEVKNQNKLVNSAMFYFSHEEARDHGFREDPRIPYSAYFFEEPEKSEGKIQFGENHTITFDRKEEVDKLLVWEPGLKKKLIHKCEDAPLKSILKKTPTTVVPHEPHSDPYIDACRELMAKCFNMCSISLEELDINEMFDALGKLIFGISSEFKIKELCYSYVAAAKKRKHFEEVESLNAVIESFKDDKSRLAEKNAELSIKLEEQHTKIKELEHLFENFDKVKEENTGMALVNSDLAAVNEELRKQLEVTNDNMRVLEDVREENTGLLSKISELGSSNAELSLANSELKSLKEDLEAEAAKIALSNKELTSSKAELSSRAASLMSTNAELTKILEDKNAKIQYLESQALGIKAKYDRDTNADMKYFKNKINDLINENVNLTSQVEKLRMDLTLANDKTNSQLKENAALRRDNDAMRVNLEQKLKDINGLQAKVQESSNVFENYDALRKDKDRCDKVLDDLMHKHNNLEEKLTNLKESNEELLEQNGDLNNYKKAANEALYELNEEVDRLGLLASTLKKQQQEGDARIKNLNYQLKDASKTIETLEKDNEESKLRFQGLENKFQLTRTKHEQLLNQYRTQEHEIQQAKASMRQMANTLYNTRRSLKSFNCVDEENAGNGIVEKYPVEDVNQPFPGTKIQGRKRDILRSLANRKSLLVAEPSQGFNKNVY